MAVLESKPYNLGISLTPYHFSYDNGKLVGASKLNDAGTFIPVDPSTFEFAEIVSTDESLDAFNYANHGKKGVVDSIELASFEELTNFYAQKKIIKLKTHLLYHHRLLNLPHHSNLWELLFYS